MLATNARESERSALLECPGLVTKYHRAAAA